MHAFFFFSSQPFFFFAFGRLLGIEPYRSVGCWVVSSLLYLIPKKEFRL